MERLQDLNPYYEKDDVILWWGDCTEVLRQLPDNSVDSIITDPPYSLSSIKDRFSKTSIDDSTKTSKNARDRSTPHARLSKGFMAKDWDNEIAFNSEIWQECLRVAKPGTILMAMGGSRTYHRLACAIEDAGWEVRNCISYFNDGTQQERAFLESLNEEQLGAYLELHYPSLTQCWVYGQGIGLGYDISKGIDKAKGEEKEVVGENIRLGDKKAYVRNQNKDNQNDYVLGTSKEPYKGMGQITSPSSDLAKEFSGYNTRLKPAVEFIVVAQKKIDKNYANNAEVWGVAGYNIDGSRIEVDAIDSNHHKAGKGFKKGGNNVYGDGLSGRVNESLSPKGRYPSNVISDGSDEVNKEFDKAGVSKSRGGNSTNIGGFVTKYADKEKIGKSCGLGDKGTPVRFFQSCPSDEPARFIYTAKSSKKDKKEGNSHPTCKPLSLIKYLCKLTKTPTGGVVLDPFVGSGTTLIAAREEGREAIGIEKEKEYCDIAVNRLQGRSNVSQEVIEEEREGKTKIGNLIDSVLYD